jgi:hypothetical protein
MLSRRRGCQRQHGNDATIEVDSDEWAGNAARNDLLTDMLDSEEAA